MGATDLFDVVMQVSALYATLFGMVISINFAMIVAIWFFLHRARLGFRVAAFLFYLVGMLMLVGMLLQQANVKARALEALRALPPESRAGFLDGFLATQGSWLFHLVIPGTLYLIRHLRHQPLHRRNSLGVVCPATTS